MERATQSTTDDHVVRSRVACCLPMFNARRPSKRSTRTSWLSRVHAVRRHRVRFSPDVKVHYQTQWSEREYRDARQGPWIFIAVDRHRFQRRIREFESKFDYIFTDIHREHLYDLIEQFNMDALIDDFYLINLN